MRGEIGRLRGGCSGLFASNTVKFFEITSTYEQGLTMLQRGRLDGFCGMEEGIAHSMKLLNLDTRKFNKFQIGESERYIDFSPNFSDASFKKIEKAVHDLILEGELKKIQQPYVNSDGFLSQPDCKTVSARSN